MKKIFLYVPVACLLLAACRKNEKALVVEEMRPVTTVDLVTKIGATSEERFRNAKPSPIQGQAPDNWLVLPSAQFRELNYRFGASGLGEVYVTIASGSVGENLNRWRKQFGLAPISSQEDLSKLEKIQVLGVDGVWVVANGSYASGMGSTEAKSGYALAGAIAFVDSKIITIKMIGLEAEVEQEKPALKKFIESLKMAP